MIASKPPSLRPSEFGHGTSALSRLQLILIVTVWVSLLLCYFWPGTERNNSAGPSHKQDRTPNGTERDMDYLDREHHFELPWKESELDGNLSVATSNSTVQEQNAILHRRVKRGVLDLASMIRCVTGCNPFMYKDYGCFCGFQGDGVPIDGIDRCCFMHDHCYERAECHQALVYFKSYKWACMGYGRAKCGYSSSSLCALQLCECDRKFAKCLTRYRCPNSKASCDIGKNLIIGK